uniref:Uncharacterized protein n=1 Tax=viral metagenome TaxID=1070528 RepID=A0A6C0HI33_9ZZZZ
MENIKQINSQFDVLKTLRSDILSLFNEITDNISKVHKIYIDLVKTHHHKEHLFGLDAFLFQNKMFEMEYENMRKVFNYIDNRMYCEYYKVYKYIHDYAVNDIKYSKIIDALVHINYPVYKDLEPSKVYDFEILKDMWATILNTIKDLHEYLEIKNTKMVNDKEQIIMGINIDNIVNSQHFTNILLSERITMYIKYLEVINKHHTKYISRLILKCKLLNNIFNEDIQINQLHVKTEENIQNNPITENIHNNDNSDNDIMPLLSS